MGYSWQFALTAVLIEGIIFIILTITNVREAIVNAIPASLRNAIGAGIGLFIALIGLIITGILYVKNVPGAILLGIIVTMVIGIPLGVTEFRVSIDSCATFLRIQLGVAGYLVANRKK